MVPMLCVGTRPGTLCVPNRRSVSGCIPTQSMGTMSANFGKPVRNDEYLRAAFKQLELVYQAQEGTIEGARCKVQGARDKAQGARGKGQGARGKGQGARGK